jgi:hypothetical protein
MRGEGQGAAAAIAILLHRLPMTEPAMNEPKPVSLRIESASDGTESACEISPAMNYRPLVTIRASGPLLDPVFCLPTASGMSVNSDGIVSSWNEMDTREIVTPCKVTLDKLGAAILLGKNSVTTFVKEDCRDEQGGFLDHLVNLLMYRSRVKFNLYCFPTREITAAFNIVPEVDSVVVFNLERLTQEQGIRHDGKEWVALGTEPCRLEIEKALFDSFDKLIDTSLAVAITYFLIASEHPQYFLVEYYKCWEVIRRALGGEADMMKVLEPHGFTAAMAKTLTRMANNHREPISFGRHAPPLDGKVIGIDLRALYRPTMQRQLFDESTALCRACIDAYIAHLLA